MTTRKYKKLCMSCGVERNLAEELRRRAAVRRSVSVELATPIMADYRGTAEAEMRFCNGSIRTRRKKIREYLKNITVV